MYLPETNCEDQDQDQDQDQWYIWLKRVKGGTNIRCVIIRITANIK